MVTSFFSFFIFWLLLLLYLLHVFTSKQFHSNNSWDSKLFCKCCKLYKTRNIVMYSIIQITLRHLVSTPIGCMDDFSNRALVVLRNVSMILAEDTRTTGMALNAYILWIFMWHSVGISNRMESFNQENERTKIPSILALLKEGSLSDYVHSLYVIT